ncbi:MAG TPA: hypothetical protein VJ779_20805 [Acetobacteraceae bacterium]|nr:hypothetical protein [Acetobacteraceae bacterium]
MQAVPVTEVYDGRAVWNGASAILAILVLGASPAPAAPCGPDAKLRWSGDNVQTTRPFHMDGPWEVQWTTTTPPGSLFEVKVYDKNRPDAGFEMAADQRGGSPGSAYQPKGGDYYLSIFTLKGSWSVCVVPVP